MDAHFSNDTSALLTVEATGDITIPSSELKDITALDFDSLISIQTGSSVLFDRLVSTNCPTTSTLLSVFCETQSSSTVTVQNCSFSMLQYTAIYIQSCLNASIKDSNFTGLAIPEAEPGFAASVSFFQAVVIDFSSTATLEACRFANMSGGAIYIFGSITSTVEDCTFSNNTNLGWLGGAIYSSNQYLIVDHYNFLGNIATEGGAVYVDGGNANITNSCFRDNNASYSEGQEGFSNGGAINHAGSATAGASVKLTVFNSTFLHNAAAQAAGAIYSWQLPGLVYIDQCSFAHNIAHGGLAGDLYVFGARERLTTLIVLNSAFTDAQSEGSIWANSLMCFGVQWSNFSDSLRGLHASDVGGQCEDQNYGELFNRTSISPYSESAAIIQDFLGLASSGGVAANISVDIRDCRFDNVSSSHAVYIQGRSDSLVVVAHSFLVGGSSNSALRISSGLQAIVWASTFSNNTSYYKGGAIRFDQNAGEGMLIGNCTFTNNTAVKGGAIWGDANAQFNITSHSLFVKNSASSTGGAIHCDGSPLFLWSGTILQSNYAKDGGGLFCNECQQVQLDNVHILSNRSALLFVSPPDSSCRWWVQLGATSSSCC